MINAFNDAKEYFKLDTKNPWVGTPLESYYALTPAAKGNAAEGIVENLLKANGYEVKPRTNAGHDRIIDGVKTEIKFGLATNKNEDYETIFNHIAFGKDWDNILFVCVNGDGNIKTALYNKDNFPWDAANRQQGGKDGANDDFMLSGKNAKAVLFDESATELF